MYEPSFPPLDGYKWDLRDGVNSYKNFEYEQGSGASARCKEIVWNESTENGIVVKARCDEIRRPSLSDGTQYEDGYVDCGVKGPVYRFKDTISLVSEQNGKIEWAKDISLAIPDDLTEFQLRIKAYNGPERIITENYSDGVLRVIKNNANIIVRGTPPKGF